MTTRKVSWVWWLVVGAVTVASAVSHDIEPSPDADFLEFLGSWQTEDGRWMDPFNMKDFPGAKKPGSDEGATSRDRPAEKNIGPDSQDLKNIEPTMPRREGRP